MAGMTRRQAVGVVAAMAVHLHGKAEATQSGPVMRLVLDGLAGISVQYRGNVVTIHPQELLDVLRGSK